MSIKEIQTLANITGDFNSPLCESLFIHIKGLMDIKRYEYPQQANDLERQRKSIHAIFQMLDAEKIPMRITNEIVYFGETGKRIYNA